VIKFDSERLLAKQTLATVVYTAKSNKLIIAVYIIIKVWLLYFDRAYITDNSYLPPFAFTQIQAGGSYSARPTNQPE